jgi:uncharacterized protein (TIGR02996 family)
MHWQKRELIQAVHANPRDETRRKMLIDWLEENNDPRYCGAATAEKLARLFDTSPMLWLNLQKAWTDHAATKGAKKR